MHQKTIRSGDPSKAGTSLLAHVSNLSEIERLGVGGMEQVESPVNICPPRKLAKAHFNPQRLIG